MADEIINEFLIESNENLSRLDQEMVELEKRPEDAALLASIFRTIHTIKGTCGFLGFEILEHITHIAESILSQVRALERDLTPELVSVILESVDAVKAVLRTIESTGGEGTDHYDDLCSRLQAACDACGKPVATAPVASPPPSPEPVAESAPEKVTEEKVTEKAEAPGPEAAAKSAVAESTIRVDVGLLDRLMNLVGELVLARNQILQFNARQEDLAFNATSQRLNLITTELQEGVMKTRMQPIGMVWNKLPRVVRDLSASCGKQINLEMDGADTELDKTIIEAIKDPLTHIVRNCCDHGIERPEQRAKNGKSAQGRLSLRAFHEGGHVNIEISDDGSGIDPVKVKNKAVQKGLIRPEYAATMSEREAVHLVFQPGFSTAEQVTSISGRGVGMDVVKTNIEKIGGVVDLTSRLGAGTTVKIKIPLTLAIIPGLVVTGGGMRFVIPQVSLLELVRLEGETGKSQIERINGAPVYRRRGHLLPLAYLNELLEISHEGGDPEVLNIVVLQAEDRQFGLVVDGINDTQEIVVKPLGKLLKGLSWYAGATIMGDGRIALILDVMGIAQRSGMVAEVRDSARNDQETKDQRHTELKKTLLLFRSGSFDRLAVPLSLVARLEEFPATHIEHAAGESVIQYRDQILPLVSLRSQLEGLPPGEPNPDGLVQVVVFRDGDRQIGLLVDQIVDIVEDYVSVRKKSTRAGILGSAVVAQRITDFLDLDAVFRANGSGMGFEHRVQPDVSVLIADDSSFSRGLVRNYLEMSGYSVTEAASLHETLEKLNRDPVSLVLASPGLAGGGGAELASRMKAQTALARIPVVALAANPAQAEQLREQGSDFSDYQIRTDRESILRSIQQLAAVLDELDHESRPALALAER